MDQNKSLSRIIVSKTRLKLLKLFFCRPKESFYIREIVRLTSEELNSVRRELQNLKKAGILTSEPRGNRVFFLLDPKYPLFQKLLHLFVGATGLGEKLVDGRSRLGEIKFILFSGPFLRWEESKTEVDFLIIGRVVLPEIGQLVIEEEEARGREINYAVMDLDEFKLRKKNRDPFLLNILLNNPVVVLGDEKELAKM